MTGEINRSAIKFLVIPHVEQGITEATRKQEMNVDSEKINEQKNQLERVKSSTKEILNDELEKAKKILRTWTDACQETVKIINSPLTEKTVRNDAKLYLAKLYLLQKEEGSFTNAIQLFQQIIDDDMSDQNQVFEAKYQFALALKKNLYLQKALTLFAEILDCEFPKQDLAKIYYVKMYILINRENKSTDYTCVLDLIEQLIGQYLQKLTMNDQEKNNLKAAFFLKAYLFTLYNPSYMYKAVSKYFLDLFFKAHILGYSFDELQQKFPQVEMPEEILKKIPLIRAYLDACKDLKIISPCWLSQFGTLKSFLTFFANILETKNISGSRLEEMSSIVKEYIIGGMELVENYNLKRTHRIMGNFCFNIMVEMKPIRKVEELECMKKFKKQITNDSGFFIKANKLYESFLMEWAEYQSQNISESSKKQKLW